MKTKKTKTCISYGRVSTFDQAFNNDGSEKKDASPEAQRQRCLDHIKHLELKTGHRYELLKHIADDAFSGKNTNRPGYRELWDLIGTGKIDAVIATELSRLSRSVFDFLELVSHCEKNKTDLIIIGLDLDTSTPFGRVIVIILVALAQFEREMTALRVRENALARLLKDGKINGAAEILGLDRDPNKRGHFVLNHEELLKVEKLLRLFLKFSSKKKVLDAAKELGITGKGGRELSAHMLDIMLENVRWRYRGLWYANKENREADPLTLPESKRYQVVHLPHGPLIKDTALLDAVEAKVADTYGSRKRSGKDDYIYLLSHILEFEDGSRFTGQPGKDRQYRYYFNGRQRLRIRCDEIDPIIIGQIKTHLLGDEQFSKMLGDALRKRRAKLPQLEAQIQALRRELVDLDVASKEIRAHLLDPARRTQTGFAEWLEAEVRELNSKKVRLANELETAQRIKEDVESHYGLNNLRKTAKDFLGRFDRLTGTERRNAIESFVQRVVVKSTNELEIQFYGEPKALNRSVIGRKKSTEREENGVTEGT